MAKRKRGKLTPAQQREFDQQTSGTTHEDIESTSDINYHLTESGVHVTAVDSTPTTLPFEGQTPQKEADIPKKKTQVLICHIVPNHS
jgi:hypothetical protein